MAHTEEDFQALAAEMKVLREEFGKLYGLIRDTAGHAKADAAEGVQKAAAAGWEEAKKKAEDFEKIIREQPLGATLAMFGVGFVIGLLLRGRGAGCDCHNRP